LRLRLREIERERNDHESDCDAIVSIDIEASAVFESLEPKEDCAFAVDDAEANFSEQLQ